MQELITLEWRGLNNDDYLWQEEPNLKKINFKRKNMFVVAPHTYYRYGTIEPFIVTKVLGKKVGRNEEN